MRQSGEGEKRGVQANHGGREPQGTGRGGSCNVARKGNERAYLSAIRTSDRSKLQRNANLPSEKKIDEL